MNIKILVDNYYKWLKDKTTWKQLTNYVEITTPYIDRHNDHIQIYLKQEKDHYILTDDSYTIEDLEQSGYLIDSPQKQKLLDITLKGFGVHINQKELSVKTDYQNFFLAKHNFIQAILAINNIMLKN